MKLLDPTRPDDPRFDPHGEQGRACSPRRRRASRAAARAGAARRRALVASCALAALVLTPPAGPPDARAALAQSLERMREIDSGIVRMTIAGDRNEVRFDGDDMEWTSASASGSASTVSSTRTASPPGRAWTEDSFPHKLVAQVGSSRSSSSPGARPTSRRANVPTAASSTARPPPRARSSTPCRSPPAAPRAERGSGGSRSRSPCGTGYVRRVRAGEEVTEYLNLGEPQSIERP